MKSLSNHWFVEGTIDFEYKKYLLLAYLQHVSKEFAQYRLYPPLSELVSHRQTLLDVRQQKDQLGRSFPKELDLESIKKLRLTYLNKEEEGDVLAELDQIIDYSLPRIQQNLEEGIEKFEEIEDSLTIEPVGITPLYRLEGYFLIAQEPVTDLLVYQYKIIFLEDVNGSFSGISVQYLDKRQRSVVHTPEQIKRELSRQRKELPNPATWLVRAHIKFPPEEAVIPVVKRRFLAMEKGRG